MLSAGDTPEEATIMKDLLPLLFLLVCPLPMLWMMRGMPGMRSSDKPGSDLRVIALEEEVARLRAANTELSAPSWGDASTEPTADGGRSDGLPTSRPPTRR
jgi:hypothetical protein